MESIFAKRIRRLRLDRDLSVSDVAIGTKLSLTAISGYEDGTQIPKMDSIIKIADFFKVSIDYLVGRTDLRRLPCNEDILSIERDLISLGAFAEKFRLDLNARDET